MDTGLSYRASNELFQRFPENVTEKGGNGRPAHRNTAAAGGVHCGERGEIRRALPTRKISQFPAILDIIDINESGA